MKRLNLTLAGVKDQKPGDKTGDGFNNVWHVIKQGGY